MAHHLDIYLDPKTARLLAPSAVFLYWLEHAGLATCIHEKPDGALAFTMLLPPNYTEYGAARIADRIRTYGAHVTVLEVKA